MSATIRTAHLQRSILRHWLIQPRQRCKSHFGGFQSNLIPIKLLIALLSFSALPLDFAADKFELAQLRCKSHYGGLQSNLISVISKCRIFISQGAFTVSLQPSGSIVAEPWYARDCVEVFEGQTNALSSQESFVTQYEGKMEDIRKPNKETNRNVGRQVPNDVKS